MKKILYIATAALCLASCSFLDVPANDIYETGASYDSKQGVEGALRGVYAVMTNNNLYGQNIIGRLGLQADLGYNNYSVDVNTVAENMVTTSDSKVRGYWQYFYKGIADANLLIAHIGDASDLGDEDRARILAETRFLRAYYYFMLTNKFGDVPLRTEPVQGGDRGKLQIAQTPSKDVYAFIISEMEAALASVKEIDEVYSPGVVSKSAVQGILARVCLYNAGYPNYTEGMYGKARYYARQVIESGKHGLNPDYRQVFINYMQDVYDTRESIWEVEFYGNNKSTYNTAGGGVGRTTGPRNKNLNTSLGYCLGSVRSNQYHLSMYDDTDLRRDWNIVDYYYDSAVDGSKIALANPYSRYAGKFRREYETVLPRVNDAGPGNFPLLRYADVLLMYAEAWAADITADGADEAFAYDCLNRVRRRGHGLPEDVPAAAVDFARTPNKSALLAEIQDERARELAYEMLRKDDLVRWGIFYTKMKSAELVPPTSISESLYLYDSRCLDNVEPRDVRWPIPAAEMNINSKLVQNEGW